MWFLKKDFMNMPNKQIKKKKKEVDLLSKKKLILEEFEKELKERFEKDYPSIEVFFTLGEVYINIALRKEYKYFEFPLPISILEKYAKEEENFKGFKERVYQLIKGFWEIRFDKKFVRDFYVLLKVLGKI
ncbi:MAG: hypothetical protein ABIK80_05615 [candidate division WOR-3 bacterium]